MLAIVYGLQKFHHYTYGRSLNVITDHSPLVSIVKKPLSKAPKRLQSLLLRTQEYNINLMYKPGKSIPVADTLSRAPIESERDEIYTINNLKFSPIKDEQLREVRTET